MGLALLWRQSQNLATRVQRGATTDLPFHDRSALPLAALLLSSPCGASCCCALRRHLPCRLSDRFADGRRLARAALRLDTGGWLPAGSLTDAACTWRPPRGGPLARSAMRCRRPAAPAASSWAGRLSEAARSAAATTRGGRRRCCPRTHFLLSSLAATVVAAGELAAAGARICSCDLSTAEGRRPCRRQRRLRCRRRAGIE